MEGCIGSAQGYPAFGEVAGEGITEAFGGAEPGE